MKRSLLTAVCALVLTATLTIGCAETPAQGQQVQPAAEEKQASAAVSAAEKADVQAAAEPGETKEAPEPSADEGAVDPALAASGSPWIDGSASEALTEGMELSPRDNFYLYVNYDYLMQRKNGEKDPNTSYEKLLGDVKGFWRTTTRKTTMWSWPSSFTKPMWMLTQETGWAQSLFALSLRISEASPLWRR